MDFKLNYPRFGFPDSLNRGIYSVALASDATEYTLELEKDFAYIDLNIVAAITTLNIKLNDFQKFPLILSVNNTKTQVQMFLKMELADGTTAQLELAAPASKQTIMLVAPSLPSDTFYAAQLNQLESAAAPVTVSPIAKNVGMTYDQAIASVLGDTITFTGTIPYYKANESIGRIKGNRVGVEIPAIQGYDPEKSTFVIDGKSYDGSVVTAGTNKIDWWPLITSADETKECTLKWVVAGTEFIQHFIVKIDPTATLMPEEDALEN